MDRTVRAIARTPCLIGGKAQNRCQPAHQTVKHAIHHRPCGTAARTAWRVAIQRVFADIEIEGRHVERTEVVQFDEHAMEIVIRRCLAHHIVKVAQTMQNPAFEFWQFIVRNFFSLGKAVKIAKQEAQCIAQTTIDIRMTLDDFMADAQIVMIVRAYHPQTQDIGTKLVDDVIWRNNVAERFRHFAAIAIKHETMGQNGLIRRTPPCTTRFKKRAVEPATMLIRPFKIQIGRPFQVLTFFKHKGMGRTGIKPDVKNVGDLFEIIGIVFIAKEILRVADEPRVGTFGTERFVNTIKDFLITQRLTGIFINEHRDRHTPRTLARYAPIGTVGNHGMQTVTTAFGHKAGFINRFERLFTQVVVLHGNEPLRGGAIDHRCLGAPRARIGVL